MKGGNRFLRKGSSLKRASALRFDLQNTRPGIIEKAELQIYVNRVDRLGGDPFIDLWGSNEDGWSDSADRSMPTEDVSIVTHETNLTGSTWLTFDVTSFIAYQKLRADNQLASFLLKGHQTPPSEAGEIAAQATENSPVEAIWASTSGRTGVAAYAATSDGTVHHPSAIASTGGSNPHNNMQPYLGVSFIICVTGGEFPQRNG